MGKLFKAIHYGLYMVIMRLKAIKLFFVRKFKGKEAGDEYIESVAYNWSKYTIDKALEMNVTIVGAENVLDEACLFVGNHTSILDCPLLVVAAKKCIGFIAKEELIKAPFMGYWIRESKCVPINRQNVREAVKGINQGIKNLEEGHSMAIFPEGTRSKDGKLGEFKKGSLKLAIKSKVPIIPVAIDRADRAFEIDRKFKAIDITVTFGTPIYTADLTKEEEKSLTEKVRGVIATALDQE